MGVRSVSDPVLSSVSLRKRRSNTTGEIAAHSTTGRTLSESANVAMPRQCAVQPEGHRVTCMVSDLSVMRGQTPLAVNSRLHARTSSDRSLGSIVTVSWESVAMAQFEAAERGVEFAREKRGKVVKKSEFRKKTRARFFRSEKMEASKSHSGKSKRRSGLGKKRGTDERVAGLKKPALPHIFSSEPHTTTQLTTHRTRMTENDTDIPTPPLTTGYSGGPIKIGFAVSPAKYRKTQWPEFSTIPVPAGVSDLRLVTDFCEFDGGTHDDLDVLVFKVADVSAMADAGNEYCGRQMRALSAYLMRRPSLLQIDPLSVQAILENREMIAAVLTKVRHLVCVCALSLTVQNKLDSILPRDMNIRSPATAVVRTRQNLGAYLCDFPFPAMCKVFFPFFICIFSAHIWQEIVS